MRGTHEATINAPEDKRFIPAYAGNAATRLQHAISQTVHPRVCGERTSSAGVARPAAGSSPRMRGTHCHRCVGHCFLRFIPAYAGNA